MLFGIHDANRNVYRLTLGIPRYLYGQNDGHDVQLRPLSPVEDNIEALKAERVDRDTLRQWLQTDNQLLQEHDVSPEQMEMNRRVWTALEELFGIDTTELMLLGSDAISTAIADIRAGMPEDEFKAKLSNLFQDAQTRPPGPVTGEPI